MQQLSMMSGIPSSIRDNKAPLVTGVFAAATTYTLLKLIVVQRPKIVHNYPKDRICPLPHWGLGKTRRHLREIGQLQGSLSSIVFGHFGQEATEEARPKSERRDYGVVYFDWQEEAIESAVREWNDKEAPLRSKIFRPPYVCNNFFTDRFFVTHPQDIEYILSPQLQEVHKADFLEQKTAKEKELYPGTSFKKDDFYGSILSPMLGDGLVTMMSDPKHAADRKAMAPAFSPAALKDITESIVPDVMNKAMKQLDTRIKTHKAVAKNRGRAQNIEGMLVEMGGRSGERSAPGQSGSKNSGRPIAIALPSGAVIDIQQLFTEIALNIIADAAFNLHHEVDAEAQQYVATEFNEGMNLSWSFLRFFVPKESFWTPILFGGANKKIEGHVQNVQEVIEFAMQRENTTTSNPSEEVARKRKTILSLIMKNYAHNSRALTDHSITFMFAGFDTTSTALTWTFVALARYPSVQKKLFEELTSILGSDSICNSVGDLRGATYLSHVVKEVLRYYNIVAAVSRKCVADDVLPGSKTFIPRGTALDIGFILVHMAEEVFGVDAKEFNPDRWDRPELQDESNYFFAPFSLGRRNCIGKDFAWNEILLVVANLIRRYEVSWPEGEPYPIARQIVLTKPTDAPKIVFSHRKE